MKRWLLIPSLFLALSGAVLFTYQATATVNEVTAAANLPLLQPPQRQQLDQAVEQATGLMDTLRPEQQQNLLRWGILAPEEPAMSAP